MLIITDRHTEKDLQLWKEYEEMDELSSYSLQKIEQARNAINIFISTHNDTVVYTSWGKDSIVLLHIIAEMKINIPVVYVRFNDRDNPDCETVRDSFISKHEINYNEETYEYNRVRLKGLHWKETASKYGHHRITGIRNDESGRRMLVWRKYGFISLNTCRPISTMTNQEVFSYIYHNNLPLCPVYGYLGGGRWPRDKIRTHSLAGSSADGFGRTEWEREYYPDVLARIYRRDRR